MISYIKRKDLNIDKYNACVEKSLQSNVYGFSWYLDIVADNWDTLVLDDYNAVMPIPWRKKYFIKYVYTPFWMLELGIYAKETIDENEFLIHLFDEFKYVDLRMNRGNSFGMFHKFQSEKQMQVISLENGYEKIVNSYNRNRKREISKALKNDLIEKWSDTPENLIELFKNNVGKRTPQIKDSDYSVLVRLINTCIANKKGDVLSIYSKDDRLVSSAFFIKHKNKVTEIVCSSDFENRNNGANAFMNDRAIFKYQPHFDIFDFGGSSMLKIADYYHSFGAKTENYVQLKMNKLPFLYKLFKR